MLNGSVRVRTLKMFMMRVQLFFFFCSVKGLMLRQEYFGTYRKHNIPSEFPAA